METVRYVANNQNLDLSAAVDVYSDWIDACDAVAKEAAGAPGDGGPSSYAHLATDAGGQRMSDTHVDRYELAAGEDDEDGQGDYDDD